MKKIIIAIDGHSSCGKSTMAKALAKAIGYIYVDTGAMYRAVTLYAIRNGMFTGESPDAALLESRMDDIHVSFRLNKETNLPETLLNGECVEKDIRGMEVSSKVSPISALPFVRTAMTRQQQLMGEKKGIVMDGRDIGTAVFPNAELKIFVTASAEVRAGRRFKELQAKGEKVDFEEVLKNVRERDYIDSHREVAPLRKADDAILLDNSQMTIDEQNAWLLKQVRRITG
ncbi:MAG: (d)CMP kinase [Bacteroidaceae bacterium]|uniref:Cytidylate kinase n=1 Tax=Pseudoprevotella muciniphila TaxID=2133944 RepID=A0A5P8E838_9BACT|nr:(d)CMP kinase [Pseudoprevotella muciniphila]MBQ7057442.1 (d)CMP kinase [Bacteroidaceae bacterium]MBQ7663659.1 (d)CMP kinase [Bacteroidaceae bacterium]QFQ13114.1 (d)CMP kinase [Pseudoprevotella muciniphila]